VAHGGAEVVLEVNGWTVTIRQSRERFGMAALTVRQGPRVMHPHLIRRSAPVLAAR
jgi:hypothetical protein